MENRRRLLLAGAGLIFVILLCVIYAIFFGGPSVRVATDVTPVKFEIGDRVYTLNSDSKRIRMPADIYNYRAIATVDGKRIVLVNKVNLQDKKHVDITLSFLVYNTDSIRSALCEDQGSDCPYKSAKLETTYVDNYQWAVVHISDPSIGDAAAVLKINDGSWQKIGGPGTKFETGDYSESVEGVLAKYGF